MNICANCKFAIIAPPEKTRGLSRRNYEVLRYTCKTSKINPVTGLKEENIHYCLDINRNGDCPRFQQKEQN
jgi:hypothetical protein